MRCTSVLVTTVVMVVINAIMVQGDCQEQCNIVFCGQSSGSDDLNYVYDVAEKLRFSCYASPENGKPCGSNNCKLGTVFYKSQVRDVDVCPMNPLVDEETKKNCMDEAKNNQDDKVVTDNKLELCFQLVIVISLGLYCIHYMANRVLSSPMDVTYTHTTLDDSHKICQRRRANQDPNLMGPVDSDCTYTVVVVARNYLTNSDVSRLSTLVAEANKLKDKGVMIHCYVAGNSEVYDTYYYDICHDVKKYEDYNKLRSALSESIYKDSCC